MKKRDKKQLLPGIVLSVAVGFLVFLYAPIDLYCSNADEFCLTLEYCLLRHWGYLQSAWLL